MNARCRRFTLLALSACLAFAVHAQESPEAQPLPSPSGPPNNVRFDRPFGTTITQGSAMVQDSRGFMWFGDWFSGLYKYDGYTTQRFVHDPDDPHSLSGNTVIALLEDQEGVLWVGTSRGLNRYDPETASFQRIQHDPEDLGSLSNDTLNVIMKDRDGLLWIGTNQGLNRYNPETETVTRFRHDEGDPGSLSDDWVGAVFQDQRGTVWVGSWGLNRYDPETDTFSHHLPYPAIADPIPGRQLSANWVEAIYEDRRGRLWVGTLGGGFYRFDPETGTFDNYRKEAFRRDDERLDRLTSIIEDIEGGLWLGTGRGLIWFDPETGAMTSYRHNPQDPYSLSGNLIASVYQDRQGVMWVSSLYESINRFDRAARPFEHIYPRPGDPNSLHLHSYGVQHIYEGPDRALWVSSYGFLNRVDRVSGVVQHFRPDPRDPNSLPPGNVTGLHVESSGTVWVGTSEGLSRMDPATETFTHYRHDPADTTTMGPILPIRGPAPGVRNLYEDTRGVLWVGIDGFGLSRMDDRRLGVFTRFPLDADIGRFNSIYEDSDGILWLGTEGRGLYRLDPETESLVNYGSDPGDPQSLSSSEIYGICERPGEPDVLWIAAYARGLNRFDKRTETFSYLTTQNSDLPDNGAQGVLCDEQGLVWISTDRGLSRYDPDTNTFKNFDQDDGLQDVTFNAWAYHKSRYTGELFFGGPNGVNAFFPSEVGDNPNPPQVVLTGLKLIDEPVSVGGDSPLRRLLSETEAFTLKHNQNDVTFDYVGLHYSNPAENQYAYMLEGYDDDWRDAETRRTATFTNLDPGTYTLRVKASNSDGVWNEEGTSVRMTILPPWWRTTWAYLLYGLLFIGGVFAVDRFQRQRLLRKERERTAIEQAELRAESAESQRRALQAENERNQIELEKTRELEQAYQSLEVKNDQLEQSHTIVEAINKETSFSRLLHTILDEVRVIPGIEKATALVYNPDLDAFAFRASSGWDLDQLKPIRMTPAEAQARYVEHAEEVADDIFVAKDAADRPGTAQLAELGRVASFLVLRVRVEGQVWGYLVFDNLTDRDAFDDRDVALLEGLREHIRSAFIKTRLLDEVRQALDHLKATQAQLVQQEKLASLGQLTAGIAHEIKNPLNFVNNFAQLSVGLADELADELDAGADKTVAEIRDDLGEILADLKQNAAKINEHGRRADGIVNSMMAHARSTPGERCATDINALLDEYVNLAFHGMRARQQGFRCDIERNYDETMGKLELVPQEVGRVLLNLLNNAFEAVHEQAAEDNGEYIPTVRVSTRRADSAVEIRVGDNGPGISADIHAKVFEPFFTTKPTGSGTGLGLSLAYDIVTQGHGGTLTVESAEGEGATFVITLPVNSPNTG